MSLATRCTACGTIFRVVQDQLRVSEGWVRCGRCAEVFDAGEQLFDIDRDPPPPWPTRPAEQPDREEPTLPTPAEVATYTEPVAAPDSEMARARTKLDSRHEPQWIADADDTPAPAADADPQSRGVEPLMNAGPAELTVEQRVELPSFMRARAATSAWHRAPVRLALSTAITLMLLLLGLQLALHFHDAVAAIYPQSRPALQALCRTTGCSVSAWRRIDAVSVENSALTQAGRVSAPNQYKLTVSLHNKSGVEVATPAVELNLLDGAGSVVLRRVLLPSDFRAAKETIPPSALPPGAELPLQALVMTGAQAVSGYSVEIFYP